MRRPAGRWKASAPPASWTSKLAGDPPLDPVTAAIGASSPPILVGDVVIVGAAFAAGAAPPRKEMPAGNVMGFDARTGKRLWVFHTIARPGEPGGDSWTR